MNPYDSGNVHLRSLHMIDWFRSSGSHLPGVESMRNYKFSVSENSVISPSVVDIDSHIEWSKFYQIFRLETVYIVYSLSI